MRDVLRLNRVLLLFFIFSRNAFVLANIQTLFNTGSSSSSGGCSSQLTTLNTYLTEVQALVKAAQTGIEQWKSNIDYQLMLMSWMSIRFEGGPGLNAVMDEDSDDEYFELVKSRISAVQSFLDGVSLTTANGRSWTPRLWCSPAFTQSFDWDSAVYDNLGQPLAKADSTDATGEPDYYTIEDAYGKWRTSENRPLWMSDIDGYLFFSGPPGEEINPLTDEAWTSVCEPPGAYGFTTQPSMEETLGIPSSVFGKNIVLCPKSFDPTAYGGQLHTLTSLTNTNYPVPGSSGGIDQWIPRSGTLFHELFHLTASAGQSPDFTMKPMQGLVSSLEGSDSDKTSIVKNPESYLWFAVACWYYQNPPSGTTAVVFRAPDTRAHAAVMG